MDLIALTTIQRATKPGKAATENTPATPPVVETIAKGDRFTADDAQAKELIANKAAVADKSAPKKAAKKAATKNTQTDERDAAAQQAEKGALREPEDMTVEEIKAELDELEVQYSSSDNKPALVTALAEAREGGLV